MKKEKRRKKCIAQYNKFLSTSWKSTTETLEKVVQYDKVVD